MSIYSFKILGKGKYECQWTLKSILRSGLVASKPWYWRTGGCVQCSVKDSIKETLPCDLTTQRRDHLNLSERQRFFRKDFMEM